MSNTGSVDAIITQLEALDVLKKYADNEKMFKSLQTIQKKLINLENIMQKGIKPELGSIEKQSEMYVNVEPLTECVKDVVATIEQVKYKDHKKVELMEMRTQEIKNMIGDNQIKEIATNSYNNARIKKYHDCLVNISDFTRNIKPIVLHIQHTVLQMTLDAPRFVLFGQHLKITHAVST